MKVSMVMPTKNRARYVPIAIRCFLQQTYPDKELIIIDDGSELLTIPNDDRIRYIKLENNTPTGTKRNIGVETANGEIIGNCDDDDWASSYRLRDQVGRLFTTGKAVTGYNSTVVYDESTGLLYKNLGGPPYLASGTSQCYWKEWWRKTGGFPPVTYGEDSVFSRTARLADELAIADVGKTMIARKHANNTDKVHVERLQKLSVEEAPIEFLRAIENPLPTLEYMYQKDIQSNEYEREAERQCSSPMIDFKTDWIPEIQVR